MHDERIAALRSRVAENRRRLLRLQAWSAPYQREHFRAIAARNDEVETVFIAKAAGLPEHAEVWLTEAEHWLRAQVENPLLEAEQAADGQDAVGGSRMQTFTRRKRHTVA